MNRIIFIILFFTLSFSVSAYQVPEKDWGIAVGFRSAKIPYPAEEERVDDFIPLMFYDGNIFFIRGLTGGAKLYNEDKWQFSIIGRYRYFDIPAEYQNLIRGNALDIGGELKYRLTNDFETNLEIMSDDNSRLYSELNARYHWELNSWELLPYTSLRFKSSDFNNYYYALDGFIDPDNPSNSFNNKIGSGFDLTLGSEVRYHVASNFYLIGRAQLTILDSDTRDSVSIDTGTYGELYLGIAFFNDKTRSKSSSLKTKPYFRLSHGWATPSNIGDILKFDWEDDEQDNQLSSIFYGHPLADSLFGINALDVYMTIGYAYHHNSAPFSQTLEPGEGINTLEFTGLDDNTCDAINPCILTYDLQPTHEYVLGIKAYYNIHWPVHWRFGLAEGISYIETVSNLEQREMDKKGYRSSNLMNYIDVTADFSLGDIFSVKEMNDLFLEIGIYLQYHF